MKLLFSVKTFLRMFCGHFDFGIKVKMDSIIIDSVTLGTKK